MSAIGYTLILALIPGASLVLTTAAVTGAPTAPFSTAATATPSSLSVFSYNVAGMELAKY